MANSDRIPMNNNKPGGFDCSGFGVFPQFSNQQNTNGIQEALDAAAAVGGGFVTLSVPGTYTMTAPLVYNGNHITFVVRAGVTLDLSGLAVPGITASNQDNVDLLGDGKIVCALESVPVFASCTDVTVAVRIEDTNGSELTPVLRGALAPVGRGFGVLRGDDVSSVCQRAGASVGVFADSEVPLQVGCTARPTFVTYIDSVNGDDSWNGSEPVFTSGSNGPKRTANIASWTGTKTSWFTDEVLCFRAGALSRVASETVSLDDGTLMTVDVRCGQEYLITATGASLGLTTRKHIAAYWAPGDDVSVRPVIRSLNNSGSGTGARCVIGASGTLSQISVSDVVIDAQDVANRNGISFYDFADGQTINSVTLANVAVIGGTINDATAYSGIKIQYFGQYARTTPYGVSKEILLAQCQVVGFPGHGFSVNGTIGEVMSNGRWQGADLVNCVAAGCGEGMDTHAFTCYSGGVNLSWSGAWTLVSGTIYSRSMSTQYGRNVPSIEQVYFRVDANSEVFQLVENTATPTAPADGEYGFDVGTQLLYVNVNAVVAGTNLFSTVVRSVKGVRRINCLALGQKVPVPSVSGALEGHGFAFDDFSQHGADINCRSIANHGHGWTLNLGNNNRIIQPLAVFNGYASVKGNFGWGHYISRGWLDAKGYSDTLPSFRAALQIAHASRRNLTTVTGGNLLGSTIAASKLIYSGNDSSVVLVMGNTSASSPCLTVDACDLDPGVGSMFGAKRTVIRGCVPFVRPLPPDARGYG